MKSLDEASLLRFDFGLNQKKPIDVIFNHHDNLGDVWFDMHFELELGIVLEGKMKRQYLQHEVILQPGGVWFCGMWEPHGFELIEIPCEVMVFVINPNYLFNSGFLNENILNPFQIDPFFRPQVPHHKKEEFIKSSKDICRELKSKSTPDWCKLFFFQLMLNLVEHWKPPIRELKDFESQNSIHKALQLVFDERRLITTEEAASVCNISSNLFRTRFKDLMGVSFSEFALHFRVKGALAQLKNSNETQETIAINWGFTDASHLHKHIQPIKQGMPIPLIKPTP